MIEHKMFHLVLTLKKDGNYYSC